MIGYQFLGGWVSFKIGRPKSRGRKNFGRRWTRRWGVLKIDQFSWTSCVYHHIPEIKWKNMLNLSLYFHPKFVAIKFRKRKTNPYQDNITLI